MSHWTEDLLFVDLFAKPTDDTPKPTSAEAAQKAIDDGCESDDSLNAPQTTAAADFDTKKGTRR